MVLTIPTPKAGSINILNLWEMCLLIERNKQVKFDLFIILCHLLMDYQFQPNANKTHQPVRPEVADIIVN